MGKRWFVPGAPVRVDPHVKVLDDRVVARAKARNLDVLVYAPHFTPLPVIRERAAQFSDEELQVYPARELFTGDWRHRRHLLALGLSEPVPDFLGLETTIAELRRQDARILVPHPTFATISLSPAEVRSYRDAIDAIEVYNPKHWPHHNRRARRLASTVELPTFASSYAHLRRSVGTTWTSIDAEIRSASGLADAIATPSVERWVGQRPGWGHGLDRVLEFAHLGWENSWPKVERTLLSGPEATHPTQPLYADRFPDPAAG